MTRRRITRGERSELDWAGERSELDLAGERSELDLAGDGRNGMKRTNEQKIARGLGWLSIGLGVAELVAPRRLAKLIGVRGNYNGLLRAIGAREIASGIGILTGRLPNANWMW